MYRLLIFLRYAGYRPFTCPTCYDWYDSYGDVAIWDRLLHSRETTGMWSEASVPSSLIWLNDVKK